MNPILEELNRHDEEAYKKAWKDMLEAVDSFEKLKPEQQQQLFRELCLLKFGIDFTNYIAGQRGIQR